MENTSAERVFEDYRLWPEYLNKGGFPFYRDGVKFIGEVTEGASLVDEYLNLWRVPFETKGPSGRIYRYTFAKRSTSFIRNERQNDLIYFAHHNEAEVDTRKIFSLQALYSEFSNKTEKIKPINRNNKTMRQIAYEIDKEYSDEILYALVSNRFPEDLLDKPLSLVKPDLSTFGQIYEINGRLFKIENLHFPLYLSERKISNIHKFIAKFFRVKELEEN